MMRVTRMKRGDTGPPLRVTFRDSRGYPLDLTGAAVRFTMGRSPTDVKVDRSAHVINGPRGLAEHQWIATDTDTLGIFYGEFRATLVEGQLVTYPLVGVIKVAVSEHLQAASY